MKKIIVLILMLLSSLAFGQRKYAADRYFKEFAYKKSAELYKSIYNKGDDTYLVLSRLADSYYFNSEYNEAEIFYEALMNKYYSDATSEHIFRYAQTLKSNGKINESDRWLLKLKTLKEDSRAIALENNENYFIEYSNKPKTFIEVKNLSSNTAFSDFGGFIYNDKLYYSSSKPLSKNKKLYKWNNQPYLNIYQVNHNYENLDVATPELINDLTSEYHESNLILTKDGNVAYFTRDNFDGKKLKGDENRISHLKIYKAEKKDNKWINIIELPFNSNSYSCGHPALSLDEKTLYFVSDMPNGFGGTDIYKVDLLEDNKFGEPKNLGKNINTESREMFPFIDVNNTLYFASDGHLGLGALDIFETKFENGNYTKPVNVGASINGPFDDFAFVINKEYTKGYFSSNRKGGKGDDDVYSFVIYKCKEDIQGFVTEKNTNKPLNNVKVRLINEYGEPVKEQLTNESGGYSFKYLDCEKKYTVVASKDDYKHTKADVITRDVDKKIINKNIQLESLIVENQIVINPIYFDFDLFNIREDAEYELEHIVSVMTNHPNMVIKIESHTDSRGSKEYNRSLSDKRAKSTRDYLISRGISINRIQSAKGYGEDILLNNCSDININKCSEKQHQINRRSTFYILKN
ncbi:OmpA family protein [Tenacibaculum sp. ZS6-P6]|uniref:OmpA family protein n=1 Tax=Tenacibaculum sp. ZS6-P6 TaxID=3447503 RepID=UPI003F952952